MKSAVVMQTDFTRDTGDVCTMYGVCQIVDPELKLFDITHSIPTFDTYQASLSLLYVVEFWPKGTVFVSVVDPGVGTGRRASVARLSNGSYVVTPDNGTLTHLKKYIGVEEIRCIDEKQHRFPSTGKVSIFHGRDLFAYCAAKLASGIISFEEVGESYPVEEIVEHEIVEPFWSGNKITGMISSADGHFGLVDSNISCDVLEEKEIIKGDLLEVIITNKGKEIYKTIAPFQPSFGYVPIGEPVVVISETQHLEIALNQRNLTREYEIGCGAKWLISFEKRKDK